MLQFSADGYEGLVKPRSDHCLYSCKEHPSFNGGNLSYTGHTITRFATSALADIRPHASDNRLHLGQSCHPATFHFLAELSR